MDTSQDVLVALVSAIKLVGDRILMLNGLLVLLIFSLVGGLWWFSGKREKEEQSRIYGVDPGKAELLFAQNRLQELEDYCNSALEAYPNDVDALWYLAVANHRQGNHKIAETYFRKVVEVNPRYGNSAAPYLEQIGESADTTNPRMN